MRQQGFFNGRAGAAIVAATLLVLVPTGPAIAEDRPRVMSLNVCTDQLVLALAAPEQIVSLSFLSADPNLSYLHERAAGFARNRGLAEEVFIARPDIVVTGTYSLHNTTQLLERLGIAVEEFDYSQAIDTIPDDIRRMGAIVGHADRADEMASRFEAELARLPGAPAEDAPTILVYGQNGVVMGTGTLADTVLGAAGWRNLAAETGIVGMAPYPLERLIADRPDLILVSPPYDDAPSLADMIADHPALASIGRAQSVDVVPRGSWECGAPFTIEAARHLNDLRPQFESKSEAATQ